MAAMARFHHARVEESRTCRFTIDARNRREYEVRLRCGAQARSFDGGWECRSVELGAAADAQRHGFLPAGTVRRGSAPDWEWDAGEILENHDVLIAFLERQGFPDWRCDFRAQHRRSWVVSRRGELFRTRFIHFSLNVRFRPDLGDPIRLEVGEGSVKGMSFNLDGLARRIDGMASSWRRRRDGDFSRPLDVVLQAGDGAVFFHEILGHALEADHVRAGQSPFGPEDIGRPVLPPQVSLRTQHPDDPFFRDQAVDDEGESPPTGLLVDNGVLCHFIGDSFHGMQLKAAASGHAYAEDFTRAPLPRARGLYLQAGPHPVEDLVRRTERGLLALEFGGGRAVLHRGAFLFRIADARWIEDGRLGAAAGPVLVSGAIRDVLERIDMVGDDFRFDRGISYCRKHGQTINVRVGQPSVKIRQLQVTPDGTAR